MRNVFKRSLLSFCLVVSSIVLALSNKAMAFGNSNVDIHSKKLFAIEPTDAIWKDMTFEEQLKSLALPNDLVNSLSTRELVDLVLDYPFLADFLLFDDAQSAMDYFSRTSFLFKTLFAREDVNQVLLDSLCNLKVDYEMLANPDIQGINTFLESGYIKELFLECYFSTVFDNLSKNEKEFLINELEEKFFEKKGICDDFLTARLYYYSVLSQLQGDDPVNISNMRSDGFTSSGVVFQLNGAYYYLGSYNKYGVSTACYQYYFGDYTTAEAQQIDYAVQNAHPSWTFVSSATLKYNCHSYAWIWQSFNNIYWLNTSVAFATYSSVITHVCSNGSANTGDIIDIYDPSGNLKHSVVVTSGGNSTTSINTISKCGVAGVYSASLQDMLTAYGGDYEVYRD